MSPNQVMNVWMRGGRATVAVLRSSENEPVAEFSRHGARPIVLAQGMTRYYWNGPAVRHPGYVNAAAQ